MPGKRYISDAILEYLYEHPESSDTLEGIMEWWLLSHKISLEMKNVKDAVSKLIRDGWLLEVKFGSSKSRYRLNPKKRREMKPGD